MRIRRLAWLSTFAILAPVGIFAIVHSKQSIASDANRWAEFGTYVSGTSGVIVAALGFFALVYTILLQQHQLRQLTRDNLVRDAELHVDRLLRILSEVLGGTDIRKLRTGRVIARGRDAYRNFYLRKLKSIYNRRRRSGIVAGIHEEHLVRASYDELYQRFGSDFGHYFRTLYHAVKFVDESPLGDEWKRKQVTLISCRMSKFELAMLAYNCLGTKGRRKFKPLVEKYGLLEQMDSRLLFSKQHALLYELGAKLSQLIDLKT